MEAQRGAAIVKTRYLIEHDGATIELDDYHDALAGLMTAEVEFPAEAASDAFELAALARARDHGDSCYANQALATHGLPAEQT